jgi:hypothetical protein
MSILGRYFVPSILDDAYALSPSGIYKVRSLRARAPFAELSPRRLPRTAPSTAT